MEIQGCILVVDDSPGTFLQLEHVTEPSLEWGSFLVGLIRVSDECHRQPEARSKNGQA
jgi:hypothetical protein